MENLCKNCNSEIPIDAKFCPNCGRSSHQEKRIGKMRPWMIALPILLAVIIAFAFLWKPLFIHIAPFHALANGASGTLQSLTQRYEGSMFEVFRGVNSGDGKITSDFRVDLHSQSEGDVQLLLNLQKDPLAHQLFTIASYTTQEYSLGASVFADPSCMALSIDPLTSENYIGIEYNTFHEDIQRSVLLSQWIDSDTSSEIQDHLQRLAKNLSLEQPEFRNNPAFGTALETFFENRKPSVQKDTQYDNAYRIVYKLGDADIGKLLRNLLEITEDDDFIKAVYAYINVFFESEDATENVQWDEYLARVRNRVDELIDLNEGTAILTFVLQKDSLRSFEIDYSGNGEWSASVVFGEDATKDDILLGLCIEGESVDYRFSTKNDAEQFAQSVIVTSEEESTSLGYRWERNSGALTINTGEGTSVSLVLKPTDNGYTLSVPNLSELVSLLLPQMDGELDGSMHIVVTHGAEFHKPDYTNIGDISEEMYLDMLLELTENLGE